MTTVTPQTKTSLLVNRNYQAFAFCTARAAIKHLITGRVKGIDADGNTVSWTGTDVDLGEESTLRWFNNQVSLYPDQPCLRSAPDHVTGKERKWAIPTILVCTYHFGYRKKSGENVSLKVLYKAYKGICQYCLEKIPYSYATKDHAFPKSKGGTNHDFNLVLACRNCNSKKDNLYPFYNVEGKEVKPVNINYVSFVPEDLIVREEWKPFLYQH
jgi:5-methylcytosine-specific restriction endonuclease McrA